MGDSPGATFVLITVSDDMCAIVLTQAGPMNGAPRKPEMVFIRHDNTMSRWKPVPFFRHRSGLLRIKLGTTTVYED